MAKPDCIITSDRKKKNHHKNGEHTENKFSCNLEKKFKETTADGRKIQTFCNFMTHWFNTRNEMGRKVQ